MPAVTLAKLSFLIVDDESFSRFMIVRCLRGAGVWKIMEAENGQQALERLEEGGPVDCIIADLLMPQIGGLEMLEVVRAGRAELDPHVPFVMISGNNEVDAVARAKALQATAYMIKPIRPEDLLARLERILLPDPGAAPCVPAEPAAVAAAVSPVALAPAIPSPSLQASAVPAPVVSGPSVPVAPDVAAPAISTSSASVPDIPVAAVPFPDAAPVTATVDEAIAVDEADAVFEPVAVAEDRAIVAVAEVKADGAVAQGGEAGGALSAIDAALLEIIDSFPEAAQGETGPDGHFASDFKAEEAAFETGAVFETGTAFESETGFGQDAESGTGMYEPETTCAETTCAETTCAETAAPATEDDAFAPLSLRVQASAKVADESEFSSLTLKVEKGAPPPAAGQRTAGPPRRPDLPAHMRLPQRPEAALPGRRHTVVDVPDGARLARDVIDRNGRIRVAAGTVVTAGVVRQLIEAAAEDSALCFIWTEK